MAREIVGNVGGKPYSPGTKNGNIVFLSGQLGLNDGTLVASGVGPETRQTLDNLVAVLDKAGGTLDDVMMVNIYLTDLAGDYSEMNKVYVEYFGDSPPARATVEVSNLVFGGKVEISAIAIL